jgi:hypothetical protein
MADALWPTNLPPAPTIRDTVETFADVALRTSMDSGPAKLRRRTTAGVAKFTLALFMTRTQIAQLNAFYLETLKGGTLTFEWKHPRTGAAVDMRFLSVPRATPKQTRQAGGELWRVEFDVEVMPVPIVTPGGGEACLLMFGATGETVWSTASTVTLRIWAACQTGTTIGAEAFLDLVFSWVTPTYDVSGNLQSVRWENGPSWVQFDRDLGWSYDIDASDWPSVTCPGGTVIGPGAGSELDGELLRHKGLAEIDAASSAVFCKNPVINFFSLSVGSKVGGYSGGSGDLLAFSTDFPTPFVGDPAQPETLDWMKQLDATLDNGECPENPARAAGFFAYFAICSA